MTDRMLPTPEAGDLLDLTIEIADRELAPRAAHGEAAGEFPREAFATLGRAGLLALPYPEELGGGGQPYEVYLQVLEELAARWLTVSLGVSVHVLSCFPVVAWGSDEQRARWLPTMLGGESLGAYCLSEPHCGSDAAALTTRAEPVGAHYQVTGTKAWITHAGVADFYNLMVRTGGTGAQGISCLVAPAATPGMSSATPEHKMGMMASPTAQVVLDGALVPAEDLVGQPGDGFRIAMQALDAGRLGIAACAVGLARAALDEAVRYARERHAFGQSISGFQGLQFMLADMDTQIHAARALLLEAARLKDAGRPFTLPAARAKLLATDVAMRVTTDAVQVLGGAGYTTDFPVERYMREAKVLQIVEGTNQIQRLVIGRALARG
ncbi:MAG TPA: acyl-CoA dehydrogenase family protein [Candidatus Limnocylindrales bacterium]|nr:acyl-CoA dehydrogenase family protein [Candidatus Limnocylindrales bacterium]